MKKVFDSLDKNKDGSIESEELYRHLISFGLPASREAIRQWMDIVDRDHDGHVSFEEFEAFFRSREMFLTKTFEKLDLDGDGRLTATELQEGLAELGISVTRMQVKEFIRRVSLSHNTSGGVNLYEFQRFIMSVPHLSVKAAFDQWMRATAIDIGENAVVPDERREQTFKSTMTLLTAGGVAGAFSRTATAPLDRVKVLYQAGGAAGVKPTGLVSMMRQIWAEGGIKPFYRGNGTNVLKIAPESAIKFYVYGKPSIILLIQPLYTHTYIYIDR